MSQPTDFPAAPPCSAPPLPARCSGQAGRAAQPRRGSRASSRSASPPSSPARPRSSACPRGRRPRCWSSRSTAPAASAACRSAPTSWTRRPAPTTWSASTAASCRTRGCTSSSPPSPPAPASPARRSPTELRKTTLLWDCGTQRIFEEGKHPYAFRTQGYGTPEVLAPLLYLLKTKPDFRTLAVINQDYAWGRDSWEMWKAAMDALKPGVRVVAEMFPRFGATDFSHRDHPPAGDAAGRGPVHELGRRAGDPGAAGVRAAPVRALHLRAAGRRGLHADARPHHAGGPRRSAPAATTGTTTRSPKDPERLKRFVDSYRQRFNEYPIYPCHHMAQAFSALQAAYAKAIAAKGGGWPNDQELADAFRGLTFDTPTSTITLREDGQGLEDQLVGLSQPSTTASPSRCRGHGHLPGRHGEHAGRAEERGLAEDAQARHAGAGARARSRPEQAGRDRRRAWRRVVRRQRAAARPRAAGRAGLRRAGLHGGGRAEPGVRRAAHRQRGAWQPVRHRRLYGGLARPVLRRARAAGLRPATRRCCWRRRWSAACSAR